MWFSRWSSLSQDFLDEHYDLPKISLVNNIIHNNEGYGVVLVKPRIFSDLQENAQGGAEGTPASAPKCLLPTVLVCSRAELTPWDVRGVQAPTRCCGSVVRRVVLGLVGRPIPLGSLQGVLCPQGSVGQSAGAWPRVL